MQFKGLVRFFTIALFIISVYQLSFTWLVKSHEGKLEEKASKYIADVYGTPESKYPGNKELQSLYQDSIDAAMKKQYDKLVDSTKETIIFNSLIEKVSYQKAKERELNLGLDLQGGMNVTLEVGLDGLIRSMANNSKDPDFNKALELANKKKANSDADYITLFAQSFKEINPNAKLASIFATASNKRIKIESTDSEVLSVIRSEAKDAISRTYNVLSTRIDQFGVAQPSINLDETKGMITVELAGISDPERVRKYLQSTANLQFWEVYNIGELDNALVNADKAITAYLSGETETPKVEVPETPKVEEKDTTKSLSQILSGDKPATATPEQTKEVKSLSSYVSFMPPQQDPRTGNYNFYPYLGMVSVSDTGKVSSLLRMDVVKNAFPSNIKFMYGIVEKDDKAKKFVSLYAIKTIPGTDKAKLEGEHVSEASQDFDDKGRPAIKMSMDRQGERLWAKLTEQNLGKPIAITLDNTVYSAPTVQSVITGGNSEISGNFTIEEAQDLSNILKAGKLPAPAKIVQEQVVGPTLGQEAIKGGSMSFMIAFIVIFALMLAYYNTGGWVANVALVLNLIFTVGILSALGATLTAPGIAGLVLTIGMAVDTNVIIFERIKEELTKGKGYQLAVNDGYRRSLAPVLDAHITTLLTAIILFYFGLGPILGFATTQIIGLLLSLFTGILVSRLITDWWTNKNRHFNYFTILSRKIFKQAQFKFIEYRKYAYFVSSLVFIAGIASLFNGFDQGVEFKGGRSYTVRFDEPIKNDDVRNALNVEFGEYPIIKTIGGENQLNITTSYLINEPGEAVDSVVERKLYAGLNTFLPEGTGFNEFSTRYKQSSQTVLPTISDDLKKGAQWATFWSLLLISIYIFIRFRDWRYSMGTLFALLHDVMITLAVFSFLRNVVPFPLEIGQHFIAAILTVIGFSMNDTVIVFDRIREYTGIMKNSSKAEVINKAINDTLSRTIMTSLTVFLTILILFLVGGEVTKGFAFAMLIGVVTGTYSSIFVAAPVLIDFGKKNKLSGSEPVSGNENPKPAVATT